MENSAMIGGVLAFMAGCWIGSFLRGIADDLHRQTSLEALLGHVESVGDRTATVTVTYEEGTTQ